MAISTGSQSLTTHWLRGRAPRGEYAHLSFCCPTILCHWFSLTKHRWKSEGKGACVHKGRPPGACDRVGIGEGESGDPESKGISSKENILEYSMSERDLI